MEISLAGLFSSGMVVGLRVSGLMLFAPFFGSIAIPYRIKAVLVLLITLLLYPVYAGKAGAISPSQWPIAVITELIIGMAMGIATNLVFDAAQMAGQILSVQMGYSLINILDPQSQVETTVVSVFHQTIAMLIFLGLDVPHWLLRGIGRSFDYLPPGTAVVSGPFTAGLLHGAASVLQLGIQIAAPVLAATLLADVVLGLLGKASPQMPLMLLGPSLKSVLGLVIMGAALRYWPALFAKYFTESVAFSERLLHLAR